MDEEETSSGTRCSWRTSECSNSIDTAFFSALHPSSEVLLWISSRDGIWTEGEAAILSVGECAEREFKFEIFGPRPGSQRNRGACANALVQLTLHNSPRTHKVETRALRSARPGQDQAGVQKICIPQMHRSGLFIVVVPGDGAFLICSDDDIAFGL